MNSGEDNVPAEEQWWGLFRASGQNVLKFFVQFVSDTEGRRDGSAMITGHRSGPTART